MSLKTNVYLSLHIGYGYHDEMNFEIIMAQIKFHDINQEFCNFVICRKVSNNQTWSVEIPTWSKARIVMYCNVAKF